MPAPNPQTSPQRLGPELQHAASPLEKQHPLLSEKQHPSVSEKQHPPRSEKQHPLRSEKQHPPRSEKQHPAPSLKQHPGSPLIASHRSSSLLPPTLIGLVLWYPRSCGRNAASSPLTEPAGLLDPGGVTAGAAVDAGVDAVASYGGGRSSRSWSSPSTGTLCLCSKSGTFVMSITFLFPGSIFFCSVIKRSVFGMVGCGRRPGSALTDRGGEKLEKWSTERTAHGARGRWRRVAAAQTEAAADRSQAWNAGAPRAAHPEIRSRCIIALKPTQGPGANGQAVLSDSRDGLAACLAGVQPWSLRAKTPKKKPPESPIVPYQRSSPWPCQALRGG
ncbi:hypothetical protein CCHR01_12358 [Colletotrichum chrysophilum]|uniref:Uncharacterized protein n=1 Tax=Colletotrichum chrysophilum TaxID=1836956 RepID=A0AAD9EDV4_9PEZI|nr:hypothetical protein CCHR01_12358 [Colletotrichum chrysophilum]